MSSIIDTTSVSAPTIARFDRQRAEARQQRWMAELEQMMLAQAPAARATAHAAPDEDREREDPLAPPAKASVSDYSRVPHHTDRPDAPTYRGTVSTGNATEAAHLATGGAEPLLRPSPGSNAGQPGNREASTAEQATVTQASVASAASPAGGAAVPAASSHGTLPGGPAAAQLPGESVIDAHSTAGRVGVQGTHAAAQPGNTLPTQPSPAAATGSSSAMVVVRTSGVLASAGIGLPMLLDPTITADASSLPFAHGSPEDAETPHATVVEADNAGRVTAPGSAAGEDYAKQVLHLFHAHEGVQAYIRDAELTGARLRAVAQALAAELGAAGQRLTGITVNGKRLPMTPHTEEDDVAPPAGMPEGVLPIHQKGAI